MAKHLFYHSFDDYMHVLYVIMLRYVYTYIVFFLYAIGASSIVVDHYETIDNENSQKYPINNEFKKLRLLQTKVQGKLYRDVRGTDTAQYHVNFPIDRDLSITFDSLRS